MTKSARVILCFMLSLAALPLCGATAEESLDQLITKVRRDTFVGGIEGSRSIGNVMERLVKDGKRAGTVLAELQTTFELTAPAARKVLEVWSRQKFFLDDYNYAKDRKARARQSMELADAWAEVYAVARTNHVALEYVRYLSEVPDVSDREQRVEKILADAPDGRLVAMAGGHSRSPDLNRQLLAYAAKGNVTDPLLLLVASQATYSDDLGILAFERRAELGALTPEQSAALAETAIAAHLARGRSPEAISMFEALPPRTRHDVLTSRTGEWVSLHRGIVELEIQHNDVGIEMAAAYLLEGKPEAARGIVAELDKLPPSERSEAAFDSLLRDLVVRESGNDTIDPFEIAAGFVSATEGMDWRIHHQVPLRLFQNFAERNGYAESSDFLAEKARPRTRSRREVAPDELVALIDTSGISVESRRPRTGTHGSPAVKALLDEPRLALFQELPRGKSDSTVADCNSVEKLVKEGIRWPAGISPLRAERRGDEVVAVSVSQAVDPAGETSGGGYWVSRSIDRGATWNLMYTGLREYKPYVVRQASAFPLFDTDGLTVEVEIAELDEDSIMFPPLALRTKRKAKNLYVAYPWSALERDSDGDGLTDLLEERLVTDSANADSDGDGVGDREDPLPLVAYAETDPIRAAILQKVLSPKAPRQAALITGLSPSVDDPVCEAPRLSTGETAARFVIGDRAVFAGVRPDTRIIVLSTDEMEKAIGKFGVFYPMSVSPIVVDPTGTKAAVTVNERWRAAIYRLEKKNGEWQITSAGGWIS